VSINGGAFTASVSIPAIAPVFSAAPTITAATTTGVTFTAATLSNNGTPTSTVTHDLYDNGALVASNYVSGGTFVVGHTMTLIPYAVQGGVRVLTGTTSAGFVVTSQAIDADVAAFATAVSTAGGTLPTAHRDALNANIAALKSSGAWALIKEMWLPLGVDGDLVTSAVKLKNGATSPTITFTNIVSGDYTVALGVDPGTTNSTKKVVTDFNPATSAVNGALSAAEWGIGAYVTRAPTAGVVMGTNTGSTTFLLNIAAPSASKINNTVVNLTTAGATAEIAAAKRLHTVQISGGFNNGYFGGWSHNNVTSTAPALPNAALCMFSLNSSFYGNAATSGYVVHSTLTPAQLRAVQTFFDNVCEAIGRTIFANSLVIPGDSYVASTTPTGPSANANCYTDLYCAAKGITCVRQGTPGKGWGSPCSGGWMDQNSGQGGRDTIMRMMQVPGKRMLIPLGLNDAYQAGTQAAVNTAQITTMSMLQAIGIPANYLAFGTDYWSSAVTDQSLATAIHDTTVTNAATYGFNVVDFFHGLTADPAVGGTAPSLAVATSYEVGVHKNDSGHVQLKNDLVNASAAWGW
jgi:hypothetical protein